MRPDSTQDNLKRRVSAALESAARDVRPTLEALRQASVVTGEVMQMRFCPPGCCLRDAQRHRDDWPTPLVRADTYLALISMGPAATAWDIERLGATRRALAVQPPSSDTE